MQRFVLFDLNNTLINLDAAFQLWAREFTDEHNLGPEAIDWLTALDQTGYPHERSSSPGCENTSSSRNRYRQRMSYLVRCRPEVMDGLSQLRAFGWKVAIVTNGTADNQFGNTQRTGLGGRRRLCPLRARRHP
ncbi:HAD hydrolase-like protein [Streptosporangium sp. NPDC049304]|uniref:HAD family hydrolase n=1 Tax=Streptosporangium sp. NPDC049304 TaxID=3154830 RepID=UPI00343296DF